MPGPGRHFYSPLEFERELVPDIIVKPGKIGIVTSKMGKNRTGGAFLVDNEGRPRRLAEGPHPRPVPAQQVRLRRQAGRRRRLRRRPRPRARGEPGDPTLIPPGYVGVVTNKTDNPLTGETQGIQDNVLQPGIYFLNPEEKRVDIISIGFNETTQMVQTRDGVGRRPEQPPGQDPGKDPEYVARHRDRVPVQRRLPDPPGLHGDLGHPPRPGPRRRPPVRHAQGRRAEGDPARRSARSAGSTAPSEAPSTSWSATPARSSRPTPRRSWNGSWRRRT